MSSSFGLLESTYDCGDEVLGVSFGVAVPDDLAIYQDHCFPLRIAVAWWRQWSRIQDE